MTQPITVSPDGTSITITNCTITFNSALDPSTGVATITITPSGGLGTLPAVLAGAPGQPATFRNVNLTQIPNGTSLPNPAASVTTVSPGGVGIPAVYDLNLNLNSGAPGANGTNATLHTAGDLATTATFGTITPTVQYALAVNDTTSGGHFTYQPFPFGVIEVPATYNSTSGNSAGPRTLAQVQFPAMPYPWYPIVSGSCVISGTANTRVDLSAVLTTTSGQIVGYNDGFTGDTGATGSRVLAWNLPTNTSLAKVPANTTQNIFFVANQMNGGITDNWTTAAATTRFTAGAIMVPS